MKYHDHDTEPVHLLFNINTNTTNSLRAFVGVDSLIDQTIDQPTIVIYDITVAIDGLLTVLIQSTERFIGREKNHGIISGNNGKGGCS